MRIISRKTHFGCRVLFEWSSFVFTGVVKSVGDYSFGIICDSDQYTTDKLFIPRSGKEIFVDKDKCIKTGEIIPIRVKLGNIAKCERFPNVETAFYNLPKYTIFPGESGIREEWLIEFTPEKHVFKLSDGKIYLYTQISPGLVSLVDIYNTVDTRKPKWKYQSSLHYDEDADGVTEDDILQVFSIPSVFSQYHAKKLFEFGLLDLIYDSESNNDKPLIHTHRTKLDVNIDQLPNEIIFDPNGFKK